MYQLTGQPSVLHVIMLLDTSLCHSFIMTLNLKVLAADSSYNACYCRVLKASADNKRRSMIPTMVIIAINNDRFFGLNSYREWSVWQRFPKPVVYTVTVYKSTNWGTLIHARAGMINNQKCFHGAENAKQWSKSVNKSPLSNRLLKGWTQ